MNFGKAIENLVLKLGAGGKEKLDDETREEIRKETKQILVCFPLAILVCAGACLFLQSCSHNVLTYGDGFAIETTIKPDSGNFGVIIRKGNILSICARENTEVEMDEGFEFAGTESTGTGTNSKGKIRMTIGPQITGYYVDAIKAGADPETLAKNH